METKKLGLVIAFVLALLITVGSALALDFTTGGISPTENPVLMKKGTSETFSVTVDDPMAVTGYQWYLGTTPVEGEDSMDGSSYEFSTTVVSNYILKVDVNDGEPTHTWNITVGEASTFEVSEILFNDVPRGKTVLTTFTFKNNGTVETLSNVSVTLVDVSSKYAAQITEGVSGDELVLAPGEQASVTLQIKVPDDEESKKHSIGTFKITGTNEDNQPVTKEAEIYVLPKSFLDITKVKVNGKTTGDLSVEDVNDVTVEVKNEYTEDMDDVTITVELLDVDGDDLEEESDEFELKDGDEQEETFEFDLQGEDLDEEEYVLEVTVEGEADDGTVHITVEKHTLNVEREKHQVIITQAELSSTLLQCSANKQVTLDVEIKNVGKSDEDDLEIKVRNDDFAINLVKSDIELDKYSGDDTEYSKSFQILLTEAAEGKHLLTVEVYRDSELEATEDVELEVKGCAPAVTSTSKTDQDYAALTAELQQKLESYVLSKEESAKTAKASFRESDEYVVFLGVLVILAFVAAVLTFAVLVKKKR